MQNTDSVKILIIDDEPAILRMLSIALSKKGYVTDTAENGGQVSRQLKKIKGKTIPIVGMSGTPWLLDHDLFDAVLPKPYPLEELFAVISSMAPVPVPR
ncbi:MAG: hypothetical protein K9K63_17690 [Desulfotignum sp.]|nr:hypothetical protein [Desulfotignum sp.]MCF8139141.1 hypothetical protein [Desulfotignum sp.]